MARGKAHDPETKAAVIAALLAGQGVTQIATQYGLAKSLISGWKAELSEEQIAQVRTEKKERLVDLIQDHLTASLKGATKIAGQADNDVWRDKQSAENLAVFYGVLSDKAIRLVEIAGKVFASTTEGEHS